MQEWIEEIRGDLEIFILKNFVRICKELGYHVSVSKKYAPGQPDKTVIQFWKEEKDSQ